MWIIFGGEGERHGAKDAKGEGDEGLVWSCVYFFLSVARFGVRGRTDRGWLGGEGEKAGI